MDYQAAAIATLELPPHPMLRPTRRLMKQWRVFLSLPHALILLLICLQTLASTHEAEQTPLQPPHSSPDDDRGQRLYAEAVDLLSSIRARSVSVTYTPPTSLFKLDSYTPLLDLIERSNSPLSSIVHLTRRWLFGSAAAAARRDAPLHDDDGSWSILGLISKLTGSTLLGDYYVPNDQQHGAEPKRTRRILDSLSSGSSLTKTQVRLGLQEVSDLLEQAGRAGHAQAWPLIGDLNFWGKYGKVQNFTIAEEAYKSWADVTGSPEAQHMLAFLKGTGLADDQLTEGDQASALLYYTFAALGGLAEAEITTGYRHWVGIGTPQSCGEALPFYKSAADKAMQRFYSGPPGGMHLPPVKLRLSDLEGGVYGPGASVASTGINALKNPGSGYSSSTGHIHNPATEAEWEDVLEFYTFHADRGSADFMYRLARIHYQGFGTAGAVSSRRRAAILANPNRKHGLDETGGRDYQKALKWFSRIARSVWPRDPIHALKRPAQGAQVGSYDINKDLRATKDEKVNMVAGLAAGYLGKMHLRGEGVAQDWSKAFLWFSRGVSQGDHQSQNGLGIMFRDGLGVAQDFNKALAYFQAAANENLPEAQVNLGRLYYDSGDKNVASQYFELALRNNDPFQALYYMADINAHAVARPDLCPVAVAFYKMVVERGDWDHEVWWDAERAWAAGDKLNALLGYWMMAERGYEAAQNNVAYILDKEKSMLSLPAALKLFGAASDDAPSNHSSTSRLALTYWTRSAAQDNVDALVKMGDYYLQGIGTITGRPQASKAAACYQSAASTHVSALAMWNLGWMHETGVGVKKDFHLAKRYYDLALETNSEAYLPVVLSLLKLHVRSVYEALTSGKTDSLIVHSPFAGPDSTPRAVQKPVKRRLRDALSKIFSLRFHEGAAEILAGLSTGRGRADLAEDAAGQTDAEALREHQRALDADEDPVRWARQAREREQHEFDGDHDDESWEALGLGGRDSDVLESAGLVALIFCIGFLLYYRGVRAEQARQAAEHARREHEAQRIRAAGGMDGQEPEAAAAARVL